MQAGETEAVSQRKGWLVGLSILGALASLFSLFCLALIALAPYLMFFPWPLPYVDLIWWQFALVELPFANLGLGVVIALLALLAFNGSILL